RRPRRSTGQEDSVLQAQQRTEGHGEQLRGTGADFSGTPTRSVGPVSKACGNDPAEEAGFLFWLDADDRHHSSGLAELGTMREEPQRVAGSTSSDDADVLRANTGLLQLAVIGLNQVEMDLGTEIAVSRSTLVQEQQWISHMQRVRVEDLLEEFVRVG